MIFSVVIMPPICIRYASYLYPNDTCILYQQEDAKKTESASNKEFSSLCQLEYCIMNTVFKRWNGDQKNSKIHNFMWNVFFRNVFKLEADNCLVFNADDYFMENSARSRKPCFDQPSSYFHKSVTLC